MTVSTCSALSIKRSLVPWNALANFFVTSLSPRALPRRGSSSTFAGSARANP
jgi:hypothetical protein